MRMFVTKLPVVLSRAIIFTGAIVSSVATESSCAIAARNALLSFCAMLSPSAMLSSSAIVLLGGAAPCYAEPAGTSSGEQAMKEDTTFTYKQTGGFIGANRLFEEKLSQLPKSEKEKLEQLIQKSGLMKTDSEKKTNPRACDVFIYDFSLTQDGKTYQALFDDTTLPPSYRPLVEYLRDKVKDQKRS